MASLCPFVHQQRFVKVFKIIFESIPKKVCRIWKHGRIKTKSESKTLTHPTLWDGPRNWAANNCKKNNDDSLIHAAWFNVKLSQNWCWYKPCYTVKWLRFTWRPTYLRSDNQWDQWKLFKSFVKWFASSLLASIIFTSKQWLRGKKYCHEGLVLNYITRSPRLLKKSK